MGTMALSSFVKKHGYEVDVFIHQLEKDLVGAVLEVEPDILAFSASTTEHQFALKLIEKLKAEINLPIIMGGPHPTFYPEIIENPNIDFICRGEGEYALLELLGALKDGTDCTKIKNIWMKKDGKIIKNEERSLIADLDTLPMPDRELYYRRYEVLRNSPTKAVYFIRGCPFDCTYCFNKAMKDMYKGKGAYVRARSVEKCISELKYIVENSTTEWFHFNDDTLNVNRKWFYELLNRYKEEVRLGFICNLRIDFADEKMIDKLSEAGVDRINFGVEHGNEQFRREVLKRDMANEHIINLGKYMKKKGIRIFTANIIGFPGETIGMAMETIRLNSYFKPEFASCDILQPYPKTEIANYAIKKGCLASDYSIDSLGRTNIAHSHNVNSSYSIIKQDNIRRLENIHKFFHYMVMYPFLNPIFLLLSKLPPNKIFAHIWQLPEIRKKIRYSSGFKAKLKEFMKLFN
jgi:radical SAM superfamily enzyme YgiQ (UPF0313 family)